MTNQKKNVVSAILCGGDGTRLWPISRKSNPKQFLPITGQTSLLQHTLQRVDTVSQSVVCVASVNHQYQVLHELNQYKSLQEQDSILILEPTPKNTAAAIIALVHVLGISHQPSDMVLICPADHYIKETAQFTKSIQHAIDTLPDDKIAIFGVKPTSANSNYGYIEFDTDTQAVIKFIEKPTYPKILMQKNNIGWNSGMVLARLDTLQKVLIDHVPYTIGCVERSVEYGTSETINGVNNIRLSSDFNHCPSISFDDAVLEHADNLVMYSLDCDWSDVGNWTEYAEIHPDTNNDHVVMTDSTNTFVHSATNPVIALGVNDLVVVNTPDALLVAHKDKLDGIKSAVSVLNNRGYSQATAHNTDVRPWGKFSVMDRGDGYCVKRLIVNPGAALSLQKHNHRAEHWVVVSGIAEVTKDNEQFTLEHDQSTYIKIGQVHRLKNIGTVPLVVIEVQTGEIIDESDIIRFEDNYGR